ncbi:RNA-directed DNA polymerase, eukaryota, reverse transcriptase zinc-binding domain protein [Tanacetum coccineum]
MNPPLEAWSNKGLSALASRIGSPLIMDAMTTRMCNQWMGSLGYARVLVAAKADKRLEDHIDVLYKSNDNNKQFVKKVQVDNKEHAQDSSKDKDVFQKVGGRKEMVNEGKMNMKYNNKFGAKQYGQRKFVYRQISKKGDANEGDNLNKENAHDSFTTPKQAQGKAWKVDSKVKHDVKKTDIELDEIAFLFSRNEKLSICVVLETHMKKDKIDKVCMKVFGSWLWQNNVRYSSKGCRIVVGWDCNNVTCTLVNAIGQSMLYKVKFLSSHAIFFYTFIYAVNKGRDMKELWKELSLNNRVVGKSAWVIMGDVNVNLNLEDHSEGVSNFTQDMIDFQDCVNGNELEDINYSGLHFTWTKSLLNPNATVLKKIDRIMLILIS